jgi:hypothetical protein
MRIAALAMLIGVAAIGATTSARADVITTYTFSDTTVDGGGVLSGSFQVDQTLYDQATDAGYVAGSSTIAITGDSSAVLNGPYTEFVEFDGEFVDFVNASSADVGIFIGEPPETTGSISQNQFGFFPGFGDTFQITGSLIASTPTTDTPEMSTWAMMLISFAGLGFAGYRRSVRLA